MKPIETMSQKGRKPNEKPATPTLYTIADVAKILRLSERTIYAYVASGDIKAAKVANRWRIKPEWVDEFLEKAAEKTKGQ